MRIKIKNFLKRKQSGEGMITAVFGMMLFILIFFAICDVVILSNRNSMLTDTGKEIARTLSVQGGSLDNKPQGFASNYYTISELSSLVKRNMETAGFKDGEWYVEVAYTRYYDDTTSSSQDTTAKHIILGFDTSGNYYYVPTLKIDYLSDFTVTVSGKYKWNFLSALIGNRESILNVPLPGMSEFKYNYDAWQSEE